MNVAVKKYDNLPYHGIKSSLPVSWWFSQF
jgi:hypothetical protein